MLTGPVDVPQLEEIAVLITGDIEDQDPDIIPGLLPKGGQLVIAGETEVGKSLVALEIASSLSTGTPLWGELDLTPMLTADKILYVLGEHYNEVIQRLWRKTQLPMTDSVWLIGPEQLQGDKWLISGGRANQVALAKFQSWAEGADLIVFDPLAAFIIGSDAENDNVQMRHLLDQMSLVSQSTGAACLVLAHQGKPQVDKLGQEHSRKKYAIRGASAIEDAATNIFYMSRAEGGDDANKGYKGFVLTKRKYKGDAPAEFRLIRDPETLTHTLTGNRGFSDISKLTTQAAYGRLRSRFPDMPQEVVLESISLVTKKPYVVVQREVEG